jgi:hypothetical protein
MDAGQDFEVVGAEPSEELDRQLEEIPGRRTADARPVPYPVTSRSSTLRM